MLMFGTRNFHDNGTGNNADMIDRALEKGVPYPRDTSNTQDPDEFFSAANKCRKADDVRHMFRRAHFEFFRSQQICSY